MSLDVTRRPKIIVVGAGFGGLFAVRRLAKADVDVLLIDRNNYHTFTPLLYQVATCALDPSEIAYPVRSIFRKDGNVRFLWGTVTAVNETDRLVTVRAHGETFTEPYDYLIMAAGSTPTYFGNDEFRRHAFELRTLEDAIVLRNHILRQFEGAVWTDDPALQETLTTIVVVGGGPTGLETAGALYELYNHVLDQEYRHQSLQARVILVEMLPHLLGPYPGELQEAALAQLRSLGVEVVLGQPVVEVGEDRVRLENGRSIPTRTLVWAAGVQAAPLGSELEAELARGGRVPVDETMRVRGRERIYVVGDMAYLEDETGQPYPQVIPVAQQQGEVAAHNILARLEGGEIRPFRFQDRGMMATIGRRRAVAWIYNRVPLKGFIAWLAWLGLHLLTLMGFRNRLNVLVNWIWNYLTYDRSVRIILSRDGS